MALGPVMKMRMVMVMMVMMRGDSDEETTKNVRRSRKEVMRRADGKQK